MPEGQFRLARAWMPDGRVQEDVFLAVDEVGVITALRPGRAADGALVDGLAMPGLINAHTHLELSDLRGRVPGGEGFHAWVGQLFQAPRDAGDPASLGADALVEAGTAYAWDISNSGQTGGALRAAGLRGVVHHELLGMDRVDVPRKVAVAQAYGDADGDVVVRPSPHALFSTAPELVQACVASGPAGVPASIHVAETPDEATFLADGSGPFAALLDHLGRDWSWWTPPGTTGIGLLHALGVLGPDLLLVHGVHATADDRALAAAAGAPLCLCPRSNLHIGGRLPEVRAWLDAGVPLVIGTDSLASCDSLDVLDDVAVLHAAVPEVPVGTWLAGVTHRAADVLRATGVGRLAVGARPGVLLLEAGSGADVARSPDRRWLVGPAGAG